MVESTLSPTVRRKCSLPRVGLGLKYKVILIKCDSHGCSTNSSPSFTFAAADRDEDFVHALGSQRAFDQVSDGDGAYEAGEPGDLSLLLLGSSTQHLHRVQGRLPARDSTSRSYPCHTRHLHTHQLEKRCWRDDSGRW